MTAQKLAALLAPYSRPAARITRPAAQTRPAATTGNGATFGPWATHAPRCQCNVCR